MRTDATFDICDSVEGEADIRNQTCENPSRIPGMFFHQGRTTAVLGEVINLRIVLCPLWMPDDYVGSIEPLIVIALGSGREKGE